MSHSSSKTSAAPPGARSGLTLSTLLARVLRVAVILVILAAGLMLLQTYHALWHDSSSASQQNALAKENTATLDLEAIGSDEGIPFAFLQPGAWSLGTSNWSLAVTDLSASGDDPRLQSLGRPLTNETRQSLLEQKVLVWLKQVRPKEVDGCRVYQTTMGSVRLRVITEKRGNSERLRFGQVILRQGKTLRLLEASPAPLSGGKQGWDGHLMPLPDGVGSLARRWNDSGQLSSELIGPVGNLEEVM